MTITEIATIMGHDLSLVKKEPEPELSLKEMLRVAVMEALENMHLKVTRA